MISRTMKTSGMTSMKMNDIHTHIVYGIDDGAWDREMSLALIEMEYEQGVRGIFCTNHSWGMITKHSDYRRRYEKLKKTAEENFPELNLYNGCKICCRRNEMPEIVRCVRDGILPSMNETEYVLMEFEPGGTDGMSEMTYCLKYALDQGYTPIIAHVERYQTIYDDPVEDLTMLKELGCMMQINLYSVEQDKGTMSGGSRKKLANLFLEKHLVDFVGTDTHSLHYKPPEAAVGAASVREKYGDEYADEVLFGNAKRLLTGT